MKIRFITILWVFILSIILLCSKSFALIIPQATIISSLKQPIIKISTITNESKNNLKKTHTTKPIVTITVIKSKSNKITQYVINKNKENNKIYKNATKNKAVVANIKITGAVNNKHKALSSNTISSTFNVNKKHTNSLFNKIKFTESGVKNDSISYDTYVALVDSRANIDVSNNVFKKLGISIVRDKRFGLQSVIFIKGNKVIKLTESKHILTINKKNFKIMDVSPFINNKGKLYVPIRYLLESFDIGINWNSNSQTIDILIA